MCRMLAAALAACLLVPSAWGQAVPPVQTLVSFDREQVNLRWLGQHWLLVSGETILKDFGRNACGSCHTPFRVPPPRS